MNCPSSPMWDALTLVLAIRRGTWADLGDFNQVAGDFGFTDAQAPLLRYPGHASCPLRRRRDQARTARIFRPLARREGRVNTSGLARGKGRTTRPRVYVGCFPCAQGRWVADLEHANIWIENHWKRCRGPLSARGSKAVGAPQTSSKVTA